jgi:hypothetical protein
MPGDLGRAQLELQGREDLLKLVGFHDSARLC